MQEDLLGKSFSEGVSMAGVGVKGFLHGRKYSREVSPWQKMNNKWETKEQHPYLVLALRDVFLPSSSLLL